MNRVNKLITIEVPIEFWADENVQIPDLTGVPECTRRYMTYYEDGRYPFSAEMFDRALCECLKAGLFRAAHQIFDQKYGNERIYHWEGSSTLRSYAEAEALIPKISVCVGDEDKIKVSMR